MPDDATPPEAVDIDEARRIHEAMTPGPWEHFDEEPRVICVSDRNGFMSILGIDADGTAIVYETGDACGIVHMRNTYAALLAELTRLRSELAEARGEVGRLKVALGEACDVAMRAIEANEILPSTNSVEIDRLRTLAGAR